MAVGRCALGPSGRVRVRAGRGGDRGVRRAERAVCVCRRCGGFCPSFSSFSSQASLLLPSPRIASFPLLHPQIPTAHPPTHPSISLTLLFSLSHTQAYAAKLGVHSCSSTPYTSNNVIINGGINHDHKISSTVNLGNRCREAQADTAFIWFAFAAFAASAALSLLSWRRGGK